MGEQASEGMKFTTNLAIRSFQTQVEEFRDLFTPLPGPPRVDWHANDSLFISFFGINDMVRYPVSVYRFMLTD